MELAQLYDKFLASTGICTDTRKLKKGNLFFALKGPNFNANRMAAQALEQGASAAVIDEPEFDKGTGYILVSDGLEALQALANYHRKQLDIPVLAITGSNGKTTTKELTRNVLATKYKVLATQGNLNNHIGVPLTLLSIDKEIELAIVEMGANHVGEIATLCRIAEPTHGLITNIGKAHLEGFGGIEGVIRGKTELYQWLTSHNGTVFVNSGSDILLDIANKSIEDPVFYPKSGNYLSVRLIEAKPQIVFENEKGKLITTALGGVYNFENIATALCVGKYFEVDMDRADEAVANYSPDNNRSQVLEHNDNRIIMDAYNANPTSMKAALENLGSLGATNKIAILGDMLELGNESEEEHRQVGVLTMELGLELTILCGPHMVSASKANPNALYFENKASLNEYLKNQYWRGKTILLKGSRGMGLESLLEFIG